MPNFRPGYLNQGSPLGAVAREQNLIADGTVVDTKGVALLRLTSDTATATDRTFTIHDGDKMGHRLSLMFESGSSYTCELVSSGNVKLNGGVAWTPVQYDSLELQWNGTYWIELTRNTNTSIQLAKVTVTAAQLVAAGTATAYVSGPIIPDNAIVYNGVVDVTTTFAGDGDDSSTIKIGIEDQDNDVVAAVAIKTATDWDAGLHATIPVGAATAIKLTADRQIAVTWTVATTDTTLSAGSMEITLFYYVATA